MQLLFYGNVYVCMLLPLCVRVHLHLFLVGFHYPLYGKTAGREESEVTPPSRGAVVSSKQSSDSSSSAMELLQQQQSHQYHGKSPAVRHRSLYDHTSGHCITTLMSVLFTWNLYVLYRRGVSRSTCDSQKQR